MTKPKQRFTSKSNAYNKASKNRSSFFHRTRITTHPEYHVICALMAYNIQHEAAFALNTSPSSIAHYLAHREMSFDKIKITQRMAGASMDHADAVLNHQFGADTTWRPTYTGRLSNNQISDKYNQLQSTMLTAKQHSTQFFILTRVIAAICATSSLTEAAILLSFPSHAIASYLQKSKLEYNLIKTSYENFRTKNNTNSQTRLSMSTSESSIESTTTEMPTSSNSEATLSSVDTSPTTVFMAADTNDNDGIYWTGEEEITDWRYLITSPHALFPYTSAGNFISSPLDDDNEFEVHLLNEDIDSETSFSL